MWRDDRYLVAIPPDYDETNVNGHVQVSHFRAANSVAVAITDSSS